MTTEAEALKTIAENENGKLILFVCAGNTCRSPMAEALFNHLYSGDTSALRAESAGLYAEGQPISSNAELALKGVGINKFFHTSRNVDSHLMKKADTVIGITSGIASTLIMDFPEYAGKIKSFSHDIPDPFGKPLPAYNACLEDIRSCLTEMFGEPRKK